MKTYMSPLFFQRIPRTIIRSDIRIIRHLGKLEERFSTLDIRCEDPFMGPEQVGTLCMADGAHSCFDVFIERWRAERGDVCRPKLVCCVEKTQAADGPSEHVREHHMSRGCDSVLMSKLEVESRGRLQGAVIVWTFVDEDVQQENEQSRQCSR